MTENQNTGTGTNRVAYTKMHGAGNDYIYLNGFESLPQDLDRLASEISDRHFGVGSDGLVVILPSDIADFRMRMFNSDGSEAEMCGNASRCVARYCYERGLTQKTEFTLETLAGIKTLRLKIKDNIVTEVTVDMGTPEFRADQIPVKIPALLSTSLLSDAPLSATLTANGNTYEITAVSMGNPHAVIFCREITDSMVLDDGRVLECDPIFPRKSNIEFAQIMDRRHIRMRVWERGAGETLACGTGACATAAAAVSLGLTDREVDVILQGGTLHIQWDEATGHILMTGPAEFIADGIFYRPLL